MIFVIGYSFCSALMIKHSAPKCFDVLRGDIMGIVLRRAGIDFSVGAWYNITNTIYRQRQQETIR